MKKIWILIFLSSIFNVVAYNQASGPNIIPKPAFMSMGEGVFAIDADTHVQYDLNNLDPTEMKKTIQRMQLISEEFHSGFKELDRESKRKRKGHEGQIVFKIDKTIQGKEAYTLEVGKKSIIISASNSEAWFYAWQSLKQLFPPAFFKMENQVNFPVEIPCLLIEDKPRFEYRGMHLDVCRHFFTVDEVKRYIDLMAMHKYNRFHWHLTEDQGWRIEIKAYPKLTEIGAYRKETLIGHYSDTPHRFDGKRYGGFYTQEEIKDVINYATKRNVVVIPEIELPGHSLAALAAYPEFACTEGPFEVATKWGIFEDVYCPKEKTFEFLGNVLEEVAALFPSEYIHIGGDECPKTRWKACDYCQDLMQKEGLDDEHELQSYFIGRIEKKLNSLGKKLIGWDEILEGGLSPGATVMSWRGTKGGIEAAKMGHDVIMTPGSHCYFDHYQSDHPDEPLAIGGFTPLSKVYAYEPIPEQLNSEESNYVLGAQANLWTEYIKTMDKLEYMAYPRASALAEVLWSPPGNRDFLEFGARLIEHQDRLAEMGVNFGRHLFDLDLSAISMKAKGVVIGVSKKINEGDIRYNLEGREVIAKDPKYVNAIPISQDARFKAAMFIGEDKIGRDVGVDIEWHKGIKGSIEMVSQASEKYNAGGKRALINGINGSDARYGDKEWLGFEGGDFEAIIDLGKKQRISSLNTRFYHGPGQWIYAPSEVVLYAGPNSSKLKKIAVQSIDPTGKMKAFDFEMKFKETKARYVKIVARNFGKIPDGRQGAGHNAWLFVDELRIH